MIFDYYAAIVSGWATWNTDYSREKSCEMQSVIVRFKNLKNMSDL